MNRICSTLVIAACALTTLPLGCSGDKETTAEQKSKQMAMDDDARSTISNMKAQDPGIQRFFDSAKGYVVFPKVTEGALLIGGGNGYGVLYEKGKIIADVQVTSATIGAQVGGQDYSEIIFFQNQYTLDSFKKSQWQCDAKATAVAIHSGAAAAADYNNGVAIFVFNPSGLMAKAAVGGQKFSVTHR